MNGYLSIAFFTLYAAAELIYMIAFIVGECLYPSSSSILLMLINLCCIVLLSPLSLHSPSENAWFNIQKERYCKIVPVWIVLTAIALLWAICFCINVFLLSALSSVSILFMLIYSGAALGMLAMMVAYVVLFACCIVSVNREVQEKEDVPLQQLE